MGLSEITAFARQQVRSTLVNRYEGRRFSRDLWRGMADLGLFTFLVPEEDGGSRRGADDLLDAVEVFAREGRDLGLCLSWLDHLVIHTHVLARFASPELRRRHLPSLTGGERVGALAVSEPQSGADPARMQTTAEARGEGDYLLEGRKAFITNGPVADLVVVMARTGPGAGKHGISAFLVEAGSEGFEVEEEMDLGLLNTSPHAVLRFAGCRVPAGNRIGEPGEGHARISRAVFGWERTILLVAMTAWFRGHLDALIDTWREVRGDLPADAPARIAGAHVTLEGLRESARLYTRQALERDALDTRLMERLLYLGRALKGWWASFEALVRELPPAGGPDEPAREILFRDARLLRVDERFTGVQLRRIGERILAPGRDASAG